MIGILVGGSIGKNRTLIRLAVLGLATVIGAGSSALLAQDAKGPAAKAAKSAPATVGQRTIQAELDALITAAKKEGSLLFYSTPVAEVNARMAAAFEKQYGIKPVFLRLTSGPLIQRYSSEAAAGSFPADMMLPSTTIAIAFASDAIAKGWGQPLSAANLPVLKDGTFPAAFNRGLTAVVQVTPWGIAYNSDRVADANAPKSWRDILDPKYKNQILTPDASATVVYLEFWDVMLQQYGPGFLERFRDQNLRVFSGGLVPAMQSLAAGEGMLTVPSQGSLVQGLVNRGAPVKLIPQDVTTGNEVYVYLTASDKAAHPNAAKLFANWVMSKDGNAVLNSDPGTISVYDTSKLPKNYRAPDPTAIDKKATIYRLLGFKG